MGEFNAWVIVLSAIGAVALTVLTFLGWNLQQTIKNIQGAVTSLQRDISDLIKQLYKEFVLQRDLEEVKKDIGELYSKINALAVQCGKNHGGNGKDNG